MTARYYFLLNKPPEGNRRIPEIVTPDERGEPIDFWHFFKGEAYTGEPIPVMNMPKKRQYQILFDAFLVPFVSRSLGHLLLEAAGNDVQLVPTTHSGYWILNVLHVLDAIDRNRSRYLSHPADETRPDLAGKPWMFTKLVLSPDVVSPDKAAPAIFRLVDWGMVIVVSEVVYQRVTQAGLPDVDFEPVQVGD